ncbi:DEAD/DEAH box helicase [Raineyella sp. LH-20]|uniref:DEAD/DEAH box helicase n=1 Tax=Raineyella sp. LH-20 TaxID=3081204 RepID=UPI0029544BDE|nr:DEAD/DEAH box helicase [Raineyella sp. LH-20]WOP18923.1 DEAD/DEAH box helicase [Raineyella sp. LH-20]
MSSGGSSSRKPKSHKADGTPKKRWTADERAARGHGPRHRGGQRDDSPRRDYGDAPRRDFGDAPRRDRGDRWEDRRDDRRERSERPERSDRRGSYDRDARPQSRGDDRDRSYDRGYDRDRGNDRGPRRDRGDRGPAAYNGDGRSYGEDRRRAAAERRDRSGSAQSREGGSYERRQDDRGRDRGGKSYGRDDRRARGGSSFRENRPRTSAWGRDVEVDGERWGDDASPRRGRSERRFEDRRDDRRGGQGHDRYGDDRRTDGHRDDRRSERYRDDHRRDDRFRDDRFRDDRRHAHHDHDHDHEDAAAPLDTMEWHEAEDVEVDTSAVTGANGFAQLGVPAALVAVLAGKGITDPFPIQKASIPDAMAGRDVLGRGRTGSGKTLGFTLPLLTRLQETVEPDGTARRPQAVILEPTRELAMQVADVLSPLARAVGMRSLLVAGGMSYEPQRRALSRGVDVIVATPGRLIDLIEQGAADLSEIRVSVLDEADEMADMGFLPEVTRILDETPTDGQRLLFSATLDKGVDGLVKRYMHDPTVHEVDSAQATVTTMEHHLVLVKPEHKATVTAELANRTGRTIVFARTQKGADRIAGQLREAGVMAGALHGGLTQGARARVMGAFKEGTVPVLVATDVAARGIHVDDVGLVLQVDPPADPRDYTHRAGRTARAGTDGVVVTLILPHQRRSMTRLAQQAGVQVKAQEAAPDEEWLYRATGARKPSAEPIEDAAYEELIAPKQPQRRGGRRYGGGRRSYGDRGRRRD